MGIEVTGDTFEKEVVLSEVPVLVDFWGPQCGPCLALMPQVEELAGRYGSALKLAKVDASKNRRFCLKMKVLGLPTFLVYKDGQELNRIKGDNLTIDEIEAMVKAVTG
jgi:thioredoxin 1